MRLPRPTGCSPPRPPSCDYWPDPICLDLAQSGPPTSSDGCVSSSGVVSLALISAITWDAPEDYHSELLHHPPPANPVKIKPIFRAKSARTNGCFSFFINVQYYFSARCVIHTLPVSTAQYSNIRVPRARAKCLRRLGAAAHQFSVSSPVGGMCLEGNTQTRLIWPKAGHPPRSSPICVFFVALLMF